MINDNFKIEINKITEDHSEAFFSGDLNINNSHKIKNIIIDELISPDNISLVIKELSVIDISFIQLITGLLKQRKSEQKISKLSIQQTESGLNLLKKTGIYDLLISLQNK